MFMPRRCRAAYLSFDDSLLRATMFCFAKMLAFLIDVVLYPSCHAAALLSFSRRYAMRHSSLPPCLFDGAFGEPMPPAHADLRR